MCLEGRERERKKVNKYGEVWLARGTQNNREPARQKESDEKKARREGALLDRRKHRVEKDKGERKEER